MTNTINKVYKLFLIVYCCLVRLPLICINFISETYIGKCAHEENDENCYITRIARLPEQHKPIS